jgi:hypothetical protein
MALKLSVLHLREIIKEEIRRSKRLLREFDLDWVYDYTEEEIEDLEAKLEQVKKDGTMDRGEKLLTTRAIEDHLRALKEG